MCRVVFCSRAEMVSGHRVLSAVGAACGAVFLTKICLLWKYGAQKTKTAAVCVSSTLVSLALLTVVLERGTRTETHRELLVLWTLCSTICLSQVEFKFMDLKRKVILITGCDSGFGNALAKRLSKMGLKVIAGCLDECSSGAAVLKLLPDIEVAQLDITSDDDVSRVRSLVEQLPEDEDLWGLVNNAGVVNMGEVELVPLDVIQCHFDVNVLGTIRMCKAFLPALRRSRGRVVNVSSVMGRAGLYNLGGYAASKHAIEGFSDVLAQEMLKWGVSVALIEPGPYKTGLADPKDFEEYIAMLWARAPNSVKQDYGKAYFNAYLDLEDFATESDIIPVLRSIEHALLSPRPRHRYTMGSGCWLVPLLTRFCPFILHRSTYLMQKYTFYPNAVPHALVCRQR